MRTFIPCHSKGLPVWLNVLGWLAVFLSPTICALLLMIMMRLPPPPSAEPFIILLFCILPIVAVQACGTIVRRIKIALEWKMIASALTMLAMLSQCIAWISIIFFPEIATRFVLV